MTIPHIKKLSLLALLTTTAMLTACTTATPYQAAQNGSDLHGYSDTLVEQDRVRISFKGNSQTKRDTVEIYLLYRAAELAQEKGYDYFTLINRFTEETSRPAILNGSGHNGGSYKRIYSPQLDVRNYSYNPSDYVITYADHNDKFSSNKIFTRYQSYAEVKFGRGQKPTDIHHILNTFDAQQVLDHLTQKILHPGTKA